MPTAKQPSSKPRCKPKAPLELRAKDVMQTDLVTVTRNTPLTELEQMLGENRIGGVPVTDEAGHIVGVVSIRDLVERYAQDPDTRPGRRAVTFRGPTDDEDDWAGATTFEVPEDDQGTVADIMTGDVHAVTADTPVAKVAAKMIAQRVHRVLVSERGRYVGLITTFDLLRVLTA